MIRLFRATDAPHLADVHLADLVLAVDRESREVVAFKGPAARPRAEPVHILRVEIDVQSGDLDRLATVLMTMAPAHVPPVANAR
ncbi:MAG TPA: hypothetical protein VKE40_05360 [Gemmataceae bacterium]|nr:hypothetical protein [Gemmataceae bacterium]